MCPNILTHQHQADLIHNAVYFRGHTAGETPLSGSLRSGSFPGESANSPRTKTSSPRSLVRMRRLLPAAGANQHRLESLRYSVHKNDSYFTSYFVSSSAVELLQLVSENVSSFKYSQFVKVPFSESLVKVVTSRLGRFGSLNWVELNWVDSTTARSSSSLIYICVTCLCSRFELKSKVSPHLLLVHNKY